MFSSIHHTTPNPPTDMDHVLISVTLVFTVGWRLRTLRHANVKFTIDKYAYLKLVGQRCRLSRSCVLIEDPQLFYAMFMLRRIYTQIYSITNSTVLVELLHSFATVSACLLSVAEHCLSTRHSTILVLYLLFTVGVGSANLYSVGFSIIHGGRLLNSVALLWLECHDKSSASKTEYCQLPPYARAGPTNRIFYWWINALIREANRDALLKVPALGPELAVSSWRRKIIDGWSKASTYPI